MLGTVRLDKLGGDPRRGVASVVGGRTLANDSPHVPRHPFGSVPPGGQVGLDRLRANGQGHSAQGGAQGDGRTHPGPALCAREDGCTARPSASHSGRPGRADRRPAPGAASWSLSAGAMSISVAGGSASPGRSPWPGASTTPAPPRLTLPATLLSMSWAVHRLSGWSSVATRRYDRVLDGRRAALRRPLRQRRSHPLTGNWCCQPDHRQCSLAGANVAFDRSNLGNRVP